MKCLILGSPSKDYIPLNVDEYKRGFESVSYIGLYKHHNFDSILDVLDWTQVITGNILSKYKQAFDILIIDEIDGLDLSGSLNLRKAHTILKGMVKEDGKIVIKQSNLVTNETTKASFRFMLHKTFTNFIDMYYDECFDNLSHPNFREFNLKKKYTSPPQQTAYSFNGVTISRDPPPPVRAVRERLQKKVDTFCIVENDIGCLNDDSSEDEGYTHTKRLYTHTPQEVIEDDGRDTITLEDFEKEIENDEFISRYITQLERLYIYKQKVYEKKLRNTKQEYDNIKKKVEKLLKYGMPQKAINEIYPFYDWYMCFIVDIEEIIEIIRTKKILPEIVRKSLRNVVSKKGLKSIVGREDVKIKIIEVLYSFSNDWRSVSGQFLNFCITGTAGIGKTSLAKIIGYVYSQSGILLTNRVKIISRSDMIGQYVGHTAPLVRNLLISSLEGVLAIDEAQSLGYGGDKDYSREAISEIVNFLDKYIGLSVVIVMGYHFEMKEMFFKKNEGLDRRFPNKLHLQNYTPHELTDILIGNISNSLVISDDIANYLFGFVCDNVFPNQAGDMLNLASRIVLAANSSYKIKWGQCPTKDKIIINRVIRHYPLLKFTRIIE